VAADFGEDELANLGSEWGGEDTSDGR